MVHGPISKIPDLSKYDKLGDLDLACIKIFYGEGLESEEYGLQWFHNETGEIYNHPHGETKFFTIEYWSWVNDDDDYDELYDPDYDDIEDLPLEEQFDELMDED